jgi:hypothetical protein
MPSGLRSCKLGDQKSILCHSKKYITENTRDKNQSLATKFLKFTRYITSHLSINTDIYLRPLPKSCDSSNPTFVASRFSKVNTLFKY